MRWLPTRATQADWRWLPMHRMDWQQLRVWPARQLKKLLLEVVLSMVEGPFSRPPVKQDGLVPLLFLSVILTLPLLWILGDIALSLRTIAAKE